ncbi:MAG: hypothetical protein GY679_01980 [Mycoplasma sp.]|nr:hypothetical protein [Mycoplasma sp.]
MENRIIVTKRMVERANKKIMRGHKPKTHYVTAESVIKANEKMISSVDKECL